ncbi:MAG: DUF58 domain-containing protein [Candidatus Theseobacter exili]|nr:DUF58 domain-containing protein [Candidatus Theseobacter exili]
MEVKEILKNVRQIELRTRKLVNEVFSGEYLSVFKGRGMEFAEVREYQPGDDVRSIDWNVTARTGKPFIKRFQEERELTVMLLIDRSGSENFGTKNRKKEQLAAELSALFAFSAIKNNDRVGLIIFTDHVEQYIPPRKGKGHVLRVIREIMYFQPENKRTSLKTGLEFLNKVAKRHSIVFLISDFMDKGYEKALQIANRRHDVVGLVLSDPRENEMTDVGLLSLEDAETGEGLLIDTSDFNVRNAFKDRRNEEMENLKKFLSRNCVDNIFLSTDESYIKPLISFFKKRRLRFR